MTMKDGVLLFLTLLVASACARVAWWLIPVPIVMGMAVRMFGLERQPVTVWRVLTITGIAAVATVILAR
jgi:hypothetical protein